MKRKRRHLSEEFKARVAKEALEDEKSIQHIARENEIVPSPVCAWKKDQEERMSELFEVLKCVLYHRLGELPEPPWPHQFC